MLRRIITVRSGSIRLRSAAGAHPTSRPSHLLFINSFRTAMTVAALAAQLQKANAVEIQVNDSVALPRDLSELEGVTVTSVTSLLVALKERQRAASTSDEGGTSSILLYHSIGRWLAARVSPETVHSVFECALELCDCSDPPSRTAFEELWTVTQRNVRSLKPPLLIRVYDVLVKHRIPDAAAEEAFFKVLAERTCSQWKAVTEARDVASIVHALVTLKYTFTRLSAMLEGKIPLLVSEMSSEAKVDVLFLSCVTDAEKKKIASTISLGDLNFAVASNVVNWMRQKRIPVRPDVALDMVRRRLSQKAPPLTRGDVTEVIEFFSIFPSTVPTIQVVRRLLRRVVETDVDLTHGHTVTRLLDVLRKVKVDVENSASDVVFCALADKLSDQLLVWPDQSEKLQLIVSYVDSGLRISDNLVDYVKAQLNEPSRKNSEDGDGGDEAPNAAEASATLVAGITLLFRVAPEDLADALESLESRLVRCAGKMNGADLTRVLEILDESNSKVSKELLNAMVTRLGTLGSELTPHQLVTALRCLVEMDCVSQPLLLQMKSQMANLNDMLTSSDIASLLVAMAQAKGSAFSPEVFNAVCKRALALAVEAPAPEAARILVALANRPGQHMQLIRAYRARVMETRTELTGREVFSLIRVLPKLDVAEASVYRDLVSTALRQKHLFNVDDVPHVISTCTRCGITDEATFQQLALRAIHFGPVLPLDTCCTILRSFAAAEVRNEELFAVVSNRISRLKDSLNRAQLLSVFDDFRKLDSNCTAVCMEFLPTVDNLIKNANLKEVVLILKTFAAAGVWTHKLISQVSGRVLLLQPAITATHCVDILHSFALIKQKNDKLFSVLFGMVPKVVRVLSASNLLLLLQAYVAFPDRREDAVVRTVLNRLDEADLTQEQISRYSELRADLGMKLE
eukprot:PhM_4_TR18723/c0_g1_i1/m.11754